MPVLGKVTDGSCNLDDDRASKRFKHLRVVFLTSTPAEIILAEKVYGEGGPRVESSQGKDCGFWWGGVGGGVEIEKDIVDGGTGIMTEGDQFSVGSVKQLLFRKKSRA